jgi:2-dehydro-3-deoxyphosphogluconate aldolase/(4S)-4-hydroxy-2-oxoglutarate aldolase
MSKQATVEKMGKLGLLAVLRSPSADLAVRTVEALVAGGVLGIEITYSTPDAAAVVRRLDALFGDTIVLGMGTLTEPRHAQEALDAGARFVVSPHTEPELARAMTATGLPAMMGALTPSEVMEAWRLGSDVVKIFPGSVGGPAYLKALKGPFPHIPMMPTGGVSQANVGQWFNAGAFAVGAGSELCPRERVLAGEFDAITAQARAYVEAIAAARAAGKE